MRLRIALAFLVALPGAACINIGERLAPTRDVVVLTQRSSVRSVSTARRTERSAVVPATGSCT
jgi:hypothetical protein